MATTLKEVAATAKEVSRDVKDSVAHFGKSAGRTIDIARDQTGSALHSVASSMRKGSAKVDRFATGAAKRLDATASFVEDADLKGLAASVRRFGRKHLTLTVLVAASLGFLVGSALRGALRSDDRSA